MGSEKVEYFITGLRNKSDDVKLKVAKEFKNFVIHDLKDKTHEEMMNFVDRIFLEFIRLSESNDLTDRKAVLISLGCVADSDVVLSHMHFTKVTNIIQTMSITSDIQISALQARFVAQLNLISTTEKVELQIKESCSVVVDDTRTEAQRIYAALTIKEISMYSSTLFFQHAMRVINCLLMGIRDKQASVREVCAVALASSFAVTATREGISRRKQKSSADSSAQNVSSHRLMSSLGSIQYQKQVSQQPANYVRAETSALESGDWTQELYSTCLSEVLRSNTDEHDVHPHVNNRKLSPDSWSHGTLLLLNELLKLSNDEMESNRLRIEEMIGMPMDQLTNSTLPAGIPAARTASRMEWPQSKIEEHILQHRPKIYQSHSCRKLLQDKLHEIWQIVMQNVDSKQSHIIQLTMLALPRLIALDTSTFYESQRNRSLEFLNSCIRKEREKPLAYLCTGIIAHVVPKEFEKSDYLKKTIELIKANMPNKDVKKRQPLLELSIYIVIGLVATGCQQAVSNDIKFMIEPMIQAGLSFPLIYSLKLVSRFIPELTSDIHSYLLSSLKKALMHGARSTGTRSSLSGPSVLDIEAQLNAGILSPLAPANMTADQIEARNKILALRTLVEFEFDKHNLSIFVRFISSKLISFTNCSFKELRLEAVKTCAQLLTPLLGSDDVLSCSDRNTLNAVADVLEKLLIVSSSDPDADIRLCVFQSFDERFDAYLAQQCHLSPLYIALYDEMFEIRKLAIRCLGRISAINPSCVKPSLREILLRTLTEIECSGSSLCKEQAAQLLAELIDTAPGFILPHSEQLLLVLLPRIQSIVDAAKSQAAEGISFLDRMLLKTAQFKVVGVGRSYVAPLPGLRTRESFENDTSISSVGISVEPTAVQLAVIQAIKNLAVVCGNKMRRYLGDLVPALIYMMQDSTSMEKRHVAVSTLTKLITHTGYVVEPYRKHPELLHILLLMLRTEEVGIIRREVIKLLGSIGALDPFKLKIFCSIVDSASETGLVVSMHEMIEKKEVDMNQAELLVNIPWASLDDFYVVCALQSLIQLLRDSTFRSYYDKICMAIMMIFRNQGPKSVQYLKQVLPEYFRCILEVPDTRQQEILLNQLCVIMDVVKLHFKQFMPQLVDILRKLWGKNCSLTRICIDLLHKINVGLGSDVKPFLYPLISYFQQTLSEAAEQSVQALLELLPEFGYALEEHFHILLGSIVKIISRDDGNASLEVKKAALDCLTRLAEKLDLSDMAGRIIQPVCRMLYAHEATAATISTSGNTSNFLATDQFGGIIPYAFDLITTLLVKMRRRFMVFIPLIQKTLETIRPHFTNTSLQYQSFVRFNTFLNKVLKMSYASYHDDDFLEYESLATKRRTDNTLVHSPHPNEMQTSQTGKIYSETFNSINLQRSWICNKMISTEDWVQWLRNFSAALIRESPCPAIQTCAKHLAGCSTVLSKTLFNVSFVSCWPELTDSQQDQLIGTLESILYDCPSTEVSQAVLNLEEFMTHCDRMKLPIPISALASRALKNRVYAKALYYKEQEFLEETAKKGKAPHDLLFQLLTINHKLQLEEAAMGVVIYATKNYRERLENEERWHERMQDWTKALNLYERKLEESDSRRSQNTDLILGRMRCLQALGDWNAVKSIGIDKFDGVDENYRTKMAPMIVNAAWALGDFNVMKKYVESIPLSNFSGPFLRAVVSIHHEDFHEASDYINRARDELDSYLTAMAGESYIRAYNDLVEAQKLAELEEVIQYKLVKESQETIRQAWNDRLRGCQQNIDDWRQLLHIRSLVLTPRQDMRTWLKFAGLARRNKRIDMARSIIEKLNGKDLSKLSEEDIMSTNFPQIIFSWVKYQWDINQKVIAVTNLKVLVTNKLKPELALVEQRSGNLQSPVETQKIKDLRLLLAKCSLRLGKWCTDLSAEMHIPTCQIISAYRTATEEAPHMKRAWQAWAMANYTNICLAKSKLVEVTREMNLIARRWLQIQNVESGDGQKIPISQMVGPPMPNVNNNNSTNALPPEVLRMAQPQLRFSLLVAHQKRGYPVVSFPSNVTHIPASFSTFGQAAAVKPSTPNQPSNMLTSSESTKIPDNVNDLVKKYIELEERRQSLIADRENHSQPAVRGFVNAISLSTEANLQDSLRLVILLFQFGHLQKIREVIREGLTKIKLENWLLVIQQLLARIDTHKEYVSSIIVGLLITVGERHPQAMVNPLVLAFKSGGSDRRRYNANKILHSMEGHNARLVSEAFLLNEELIRCAISWMEMWTECLEDASRLYYEDKNVLAMFKILYPLHLLMEREIETLDEVAFYNEYYGDLSSAKNLCVRFESSNYKTDLTQAWEIYSNLYRKWSKQISNFSTIELSVSSPRLHDYNDWILAIPGSYDSNRPVVRISSIKNCLNMMTSKQHPRKLTIIGSDGHNYMFLLKGHEDIRQDERAMQFFGLINTLLVSDPQTFRRNLSIQRMSIIPLSTNTGLIGWVPNSDTLNALIREYREKSGILLNREHKEMLKVAPDFEKLNIIQKTEVFEAGIRESDGKDLAHLLWLKSHNSEAWFERRTNFIRSLAVMSMVGYILGLGDRHPSNIMLCRDSGKVIHIDFGDCFEVATMREKYPEKVPFRLTRMLIGAMEVTGIEGLFRQTCIQIVNLMRRNRESLLAVLEAFIHDPLLQWVLHDNSKRNTGENATDATESLVVQHEAVNEIRKSLRLPSFNSGYFVMGGGQTSNVQRQQPSRHNSVTVPLLSENVRIFTDSNYPDSKTLRNPYSVNQWRHHLCNGPWLGCYNTALKMRKRAQDGSVVVERNGLEGLIFSAKPPISEKYISDDNEDDWAGANIRAMDVMNHIQNKLEGKEVGENLTPEQHVDMLVKQATSNYNLCQMYFGWCAFW